MKCPNCLGEGWFEGDLHRNRRCKTCDGTGNVPNEWGEAMKKMNLSQFTGHKTLFAECPDGHDELTLVLGSDNAILHVWNSLRRIVNDDGTMKKENEYFVTFKIRGDYLKNAT